MNECPALVPPDQLGWGEWSTFDQPTNREDETMTTECDCSPDYGPCESHAELLVSREGASHRTADELAACFIDDAQSLGVELSRTAELDLDDMEWDGGWLANPDDADTLRHYLSQVESDVYSLDGGPYWVQWDDGYTIQRLTSGPLFDDVSV